MRRIFLENDHIDHEQICIFQLFVVPKYVKELRDEINWRS
jgi:hypothetical protein